MIQALYDSPLPNNGDRYDLSQEELDDLLYKAYMNGYKWGKEVSAATVIATTSNGAFFTDKDDPTNWKEIWIK
jgi:hypothetical protein